MTAKAYPTNHIARLYVIVAMLAVFFVLWANIAVHPWSSRSKPAATLTTAPANPTASTASANLASGQQPLTATRSS
jgi:hypothetical protein